MGDLLTIMSLIVAGISGVAGIIWSTHYREAKKAEMAAKDAGYLAKESEYKSQLETKEASIKFFKLITDPKYVDKVEKIIDEQKSNIIKLQETIQQLKNQLTEANSQNDALKTEISKLSISDNERDSLMVFTTGSSTALNGLYETAGNFAVVEGKIEKTWEEIGRIKFPLDQAGDYIIARPRESAQDIKADDESHDAESPVGVEET